MRDCEFICALAHHYTGFDYPQQRLETIWKEALLYQFHDILPGSSIKRVYDESVPRYRALLKEVEEITARASLAFAKDLTIGENEVLAVNTQLFDRTVPLSDNLSAQVPAYGWSAIGTATAQAQKSDVTVGDRLLENSLLKVQLDEHGNLASVFDKQMNREVLNRERSGTNLVIYEDNGDCWDIDFTYADKKPYTPALVGCETIVEKNGMQFTYSYNQSTIVQRVSLAPFSKKLVFHTDVEWQETNRMLRTRFPVDIRADEADCNIQFGYIKRPTHQNTSWDYAKFEVCAHKWVSISENGYGVALINDCKYGFKVWDNVLDVNLLRSPMYPGMDADKGSHSFDYELMVHDGTIGEVNREGYLFNSPALRCNPLPSQGSLHKSASFLSVDQSNVLVEALKLSEDGDGYILRLYEAENRYTNARITADGLKQAILTDMIERPLEPLQVEESSFELLFKPFEIHTVKILCEIAK